MADEGDSRIPLSGAIDDGGDEDAFVGRIRRDDVRAVG